MSQSNNSVKSGLDLDAVLAAVQSNPELRSALLASLTAFKPTWHVDDKGMVILEASGNPWSAANGYMSGATAARFLDRAADIAKEIRASVGKEVATQYRVPTGKLTSNGKKQYTNATGKVLFQLDPPAAPKDEKTSTLAAEGTVVQGVNANTSPDVQALIGALLGKK